MSMHYTALKTIELLQGYLIDMTTRKRLFDATNRIVVKA